MGPGARYYVSHGLKIVEDLKGGGIKFVFKCRWDKPTTKKSGSRVKNVFSPGLTDNPGGFENLFFDRKFDSPRLNPTELVNNVNP